MSEIEELKQCLESDDFDVAINIGHRLKGNGETFGFPAISAIGILMEKAAHLKDREKLRETIADLTAHVEQNLKSF
ncbi:MAG: Hpt domain-containing protein [Bacteriovorax sp.]